AEVSAILSGGMTGQLFLNNTLLDDLSGELPAGDYQLAVRSERPDHGRSYTVTVRATELTAGHSRPCTAPCVIPISADGLTEVSTSGEQDVRLRLMDGDRLLAESDDRPGGWDALLLEDLPAGRYTVVVSPVGTDRAQTTVSLRQPPLQTAEALTAGGSVTLQLGDGVLEVPISAPAGGILLAEAQANESIGLAIVQGDRVLSADSGEQARAGAWLSPDLPARLRVWSVDRRGSLVTVSAAHTAPAALPAGTIQAPVLAGQAAARVATPRGGAFRVSSAGEVCTVPGQPCAPLDGLATTTGESLVVIVPASTDAATLPVTVAEDVLPTGRWGRVVVPASGARWAVAAGQGPLLVIAQTNHGQPGLRLVDPAAPEGAGSVSAAGERLAVAAHAGLSSPTITLWPADGAERLPVRVRAWRFEPPRSDRLSVGGQDVPIPAGAATRRVLARPGPVTIALPTGLAAVVDTASGEQVYYADGAAEVIAVDSVRSVLLLNPTAASDIARIVALPEGVAEPVLRLGAPLEQVLAHRQLQRLWIPDGGQTVHAAGAIGGLTWLGADGAVARTAGSTMALGESGGWLEVSALPGTAVLWLGEDGLVPTGGEAEALTLPARVTLSGASKRLTVEGDAGAVLQVGIAAPAVVVVTTGGREVAEVLLQGGAVDVPLAEGGASVVVRALGGGTLRGALSLQAASPTPLADGIGEPIALSPGERRWFSVTLSGEQELGVGVQSSSDRVGVVLVDESGVQLGEGRVQLHTLQAGRYLLGLSLPPDARPATARPALVGRIPRGDGPPEDVIRAYVEGER
ncbi:MAG: hypothetical protein ACI8S6_002729, partial [Myxococcota bacterium]